MSTLNQNLQVQYVYRCCFFLIFDQTTMAKEQNHFLMPSSAFCSESCIEVSKS